MNKTIYVFVSVSGIILAISAVGKFFSLPIFAVILYNLFSLPVFLSSVASILISALELSAGITLILHPDSVFSRAVGFFIYLSFAITQAYIIATRGDSGGECGCFGAIQGAIIYRISTSHWFMLVFDIFFAGALYIGMNRCIRQNCLAE